MRVLAPRTTGRRNGDVSEHGDQRQDADRNALSAVKAVSPGYPLCSRCVADAIGQTDRVTRDIPPRGEVWVDGQLLQAIGATPGDALKLGEKTFRIGKVIAIEPDRGTQFINFARASC